MPLLNKTVESHLRDLEFADNTVIILHETTSVLARKLKIYLTQ